MKTLNFNLDEISEFLEAIKKLQSDTEAKKSSFYNFSFEINEPFPNQTSEDLKAGQRFLWEPILSKPSQSEQGQEGTVVSCEILSGGKKTSKYNKFFSIRKSIKKAKKFRSDII